MAIDPCCRLVAHCGPGATSPTVCSNAGQRAVAHDMRSNRMQPLKFGIGQSVVRKEDDPLLRGRGRYVADTAARGTLHADSAALAARPCSVSHRCGESAGDAGRAARAHRRRHRRSRAAAVHCGVSERHGRRAALSDPAARRGAPRRRCDCLRGRRYARSRQGRRRGDRGRLAGAAARHRHRRGAEAGRAAGLAAAPQQCRLRRRARRPGGDRARLRASGENRGADAGQSASGDAITSTPAASSPNTMRRTTA